MVVLIDLRFCFGRFCWSYRCGVVSVHGWGPGCFWGVFCIRLLHPFPLFLNCVFFTFRAAQNALDCLLYLIVMFVRCISYRLFTFSSPHAGPAVRAESAPLSAVTKVAGAMKHCRCRGHDHLVRCGSTLRYFFLSVFYFVLDVSRLSRLFSLIVFILVVFLVF